MKDAYVWEGLKKLKKSQSEEWNNFLNPCQGKVNSSVTLEQHYCSHKEIQSSPILSALGLSTPKLRNSLERTDDPQS